MREPIATRSGLWAGRELVEVLQAFGSAVGGAVAWRRLRSGLGFTEEEALLVFPDAERQLNLEALEHLPTFVRRKGLARVVLVFGDEALADPETAARAEALASDQVVVRRLGDHRVSQLLRYFRLHAFTKKVFVISLKRPFAEPGLLSLPGYGYPEMIRYYLMAW